MLEKSLGLLFFLKQPKNQKQKERYVYLRITVNGISRELSTKRVWFPDRWNQSSGRATGSKEDAQTLNAYLEQLTSKLHQAKTHLIETGKTITSDLIKDFATGNGAYGREFLKVFAEHNERIKSLIGKDYASRTHKRYKTAYDHVASFILWKYGREDIKLTELNFEFAEAFSTWLKLTKKCAHNSSMKYISTVKSIILSAIKKGWLRLDPFAEFKITQKDVHIVPLFQNEIDAIRLKHFGLPRLDLVKDVFVFCCYTGLAYADVEKLKEYEIVLNNDGAKWILTSRQKTEIPQRIPLLKPALDLIDKYADHPIHQKDQRVFPVLSNQKMNAYLKEIADLCGITKKLTFHLARHTFATTIALSNGIPMETVSRMLGHKTMRQTQHYAKVVDLKISNDMEKLKAKFG